MSQGSPASPQLPAPQSQPSPLQPQPDPPDLPPSPTAQLHPAKLLHSPEPRELLVNTAQLHWDSAEFQRGPEHMELIASPAAPLAEDMDAPQSPSPPHSEPAKLQTTAVSPHADPETKPGSSGHPGGLAGTRSPPAEHPEGPAPAPDPEQMHESSAQLGPSSSRGISTSTEEQLIATTSPPSPVHCSSALCSNAHSPPRPGGHTPPPDPAGQQSLLLCSPAPVGPSQVPQRPTDDCGPPLDREPPGTSSQLLPHCRVAHTVFKLHPPLCARSGRVIDQDSPKALSAPCSPAPPQPARRLSASQPASPVHSQRHLASAQLAGQPGGILKCTSRRSHEDLDWVSIQTGLADQRQTVEPCLASLSPASNLTTDDTGDKLSKKRSPAGSSPPSPGRFSVAPVPPDPAPHSLVPSDSRGVSCLPHAGAEVGPPPPQNPCGSSSKCTESTDVVQQGSAGCSPAQGRQMAPGGSRLSAASAPAGPRPATDRSSREPSSLLESPVRSPEPPVGSRAGTARPTYLHLFQSNDGVAAPHPHPSAEPEMSQLSSSPVVSIVSKAAGISDAPGDPAQDQEKLVCGSAEDTQTNVSPASSAHPSLAPSLTTSLPSWRPSPCHHSRSHAAQGSALRVENTSKSSPSSAPTTQSSLAQTTAHFQSSAHSLAQSTPICCGSHQSPVGNTETSPGPSSSLNVAVGASLVKLSSSLPDLALSESGPNEADNVGEMTPEPVSSSLSSQARVSSPSPLGAPQALGQPSSGSGAPPGLTSTQAAPSPRRPGCSSPPQVTRSPLSCSNIPEARACAQALSPRAGTSSPAGSQKCGQLQTADTQAHPSPASSPSEEPPSPGPDSPGRRGAAALTQEVPALRASAAAEGEYQEEQTGRVGKVLTLSPPCRSQLGRRRDGREETGKREEGASTAGGAG